MTDDLELFYTQEDVITLFDYKYGDYEWICSLALEWLKADTDKDKIAIEV